MIYNGERTFDDTTSRNLNRRLELRLHQSQMHATRSRSGLDGTAAGTAQEGMIEIKSEGHMNKSW